MSDRPTPPPFPNRRPKPLVLPYSAMGARSRSHWTGAGLILLAIGVAIVATGVVNARVLVTGLGVPTLGTGLWSLRRGWRSSERTRLFEVYEEGLLVDGNLRAFTDVVAVRRRNEGNRGWDGDRKSYWLEYSDGTFVGVGPWITNFKPIQRAILERLPDEVRARILADSRLVE